MAECFPAWRTAKRRYKKHKHKKLVEAFKTGNLVEKDVQIHKSFCSQEEECFDPAIAEQRFLTVVHVLQRKHWKHRIKKVVEFGCGDSAFLKRHLRELPISEIIQVDINFVMMHLCWERACPTTADLDKKKRSEPQRVVFFSGDACQPDPRYLGADAVVALELLQYLSPKAVDELVHNVFVYIQPFMVIITTANANFKKCLSQAYIENVFHNEHVKRLWTKKDFEDWAAFICFKHENYMVRFLGIGLGPPEFDQTCHHTQVAVFMRRDRPSDTDDSPSREADTAPGPSTSGEHVNIEKPLITVGVTMELSYYTSEERLIEPTIMDIDAPGSVEYIFWRSFVLPNMNHTTMFQLMCPDAGMYCNSADEFRNLLVRMGFQMRKSRDKPYRRGALIASNTVPRKPTPEDTSSSTEVEIDSYLGLRVKLKNILYATRRSETSRMRKPKPPIRKSDVEPSISRPEAQPSAADSSSAKAGPLPSRRRRPAPVEGDLEPPTSQAVALPSDADSSSTVTISTKKEYVVFRKKMPKATVTKPAIEGGVEPSTSGVVARPSDVASKSDTKSEYWLFHKGWKDTSKKRAVQGVTEVSASLTPTTTPSLTSEQMVQLRRLGISVESIQTPSSPLDVVTTSEQAEPGREVAWHGFRVLTHTSLFAIPREFLGVMRQRGREWDTGSESGIESVQIDVIPIRMATEEDEVNQFDVSWWSIMMERPFDEYYETDWTPIEQRQLIWRRVGGYDTPTDTWRQNIWQANLDEQRLTITNVSDTEDLMGTSPHDAAEMLQQLALLFRSSASASTTDSGLSEAAGTPRSLQHVLQHFKTHPLGAARRGSWPAYGERPQRAPTSSASTSSSVPSRSPPSRGRDDKTEQTLEECKERLIALQVAEVPQPGTSKKPETEVRTTTKPLEERADDSDQMPKTPEEKKEEIEGEERARDSDQAPKIPEGKKEVIEREERAGDSDQMPKTPEEKKEEIEGEERAGDFDQTPKTPEEKKEVIEGEERTGDFDQTPKTPEEKKEEIEGEERAGDFDQMPKTSEEKKEEIEGEERAGDFDQTSKTPEEKKEEIEGEERAGDSDQMPKTPEEKKEEIEGEERAGDSDQMPKTPEEKKEEIERAVSPLEKRDDTQPEAQPEEPKKTKAKQRDGAANLELSGMIRWRDGTKEPKSHRKPADREQKKITREIAKKMLTKAMGAVPPPPPTPTKRRHPPPLFLNIGDPFGEDEDERRARMMRVAESLAKDLEEKAKAEREAATLTKKPIEERPSGLWGADDPYGSSSSTSLWRPLKQKPEYTSEDAMLKRHHRMQELQTEKSSTRSDELPPRILRKDLGIVVKDAAKKRHTLAEYGKHIRKHGHEADDEASATTSDLSARSILKTGEREQQQLEEARALDPKQVRFDEKQSVREFQGEDPDDAKRWEIPVDPEEEERALKRRVEKQQALEKREAAKEESGFYFRTIRKPDIFSRERKQRRRSFLEGEDSWTTDSITQEEDSESLERGAGILPSDPLEGIFLDMRARLGQVRPMARALRNRLATEDKRQDVKGEDVEPMELEGETEETLRRRLEETVAIDASWVLEELQVVRSLLKEPIARSRSDPDVKEMVVPSRETRSDDEISRQLYRRRSQLDPEEVLRMRRQREEARAREESARISEYRFRTQQKSDTQQRRSESSEESAIKAVRKTARLVEEVKTPAAIKDRKSLDENQPLESDSSTETRRQREIETTEEDSSGKEVHGQREKDKSRRELIEKEAEDATKKHGTESSAESTSSTKKKRRTHRGRRRKSQKAEEKGAVPKSQPAEEKVEPRKPQEVEVESREEPEKEIEAEGIPLSDDTMFQMLRDPTIEATVLAITTPEQAQRYIWLRDRIRAAEAKASILEVNTQRTRIVRMGAEEELAERLMAQQRKKEKKEAKKDERSAKEEKKYERSPKEAKKDERPTKEAKKDERSPKEAKKEERPIKEAKKDERPIKEAKKDERSPKEAKKDERSPKDAKKDERPTKEPAKTEQVQQEMKRDRSPAMDVPSLPELPKELSMKKLSEVIETEAILDWLLREDESRKPAQPEAVAEDDSKTREESRREEREREEQLARGAVRRPPKPAQEEKHRKKKTESLGMRAGEEHRRYMEGDSERRPEEVPEDRRRYIEEYMEETPEQVQEERRRKAAESTESSPEEGSQEERYKRRLEAIKKADANLRALEALPQIELEAEQSMMQPRHFRLFGKQGEWTQELEDETVAEQMALIQSMVAKMDGKHRAEESPAQEGPSERKDLEATFFLHPRKKDFQHQARSKPTGEEATTKAEEEITVVEKRVILAEGEVSLRREVGVNVEDETTRRDKELEAAAKRESHQRFLDYKKAHENDPVEVFRRKQREEVKGLISMARKALGDAEDPIRKQRKEHIDEVLVQLQEEEEEEAREKRRGQRRPSSPTPAVSGDVEPTREEGIQTDDRQTVQRRMFVTSMLDKTDKQAPLVEKIKKQRKEINTLLLLLQYQAKEKLEQEQEQAEAEAKDVSAETKREEGKEEKDKVKDETKSEDQKEGKAKDKDIPSETKSEEGKGKDISPETKSEEGKEETKSKGGKEEKDIPAETKSAEGEEGKSEDRDVSSETKSEKEKVKDIHPLETKSEEGKDKDIFPEAKSEEGKEETKSKGGKEEKDIPAETKSEEGKAETKSKGGKEEKDIPTETKSSEEGEEGKGKDKDVPSEIKSGKDKVKDIPPETKSEEQKEGKDVSPEIKSEKGKEGEDKDMDVLLVAKSEEEKDEGRQEREEPRKDEE